MTPIIEPVVPPVRSDWIERCRARILEHEPALAADDVLELATALSERPSCRAVPPERAAELLFARTLQVSAWGDFEH